MIVDERDIHKKQETDEAEMKQLLDSCTADDPVEKSWLFRYHELMSAEEKSKGIDKIGNDANRSAASNSKSEGKKAKNSSKKGQKPTIIPLSGSIDIKDLHEL